MSRDVCGGALNKKATKEHCDEAKSSSDALICHITAENCIPYCWLLVNDTIHHQYVAINDRAQICKVQDFQTDMDTTMTKRTLDQTIGRA